MVETVVPVPALRERTADVLPLARYAARQTRLREVDITPAAERVPTGYDWPGNIDELFRLIHAAALVGRPGPHLSRIESVERDEIIRYLSRPGTPVAAAAAELSLSRATIYRRMARLEITMPK